MAQLIDEQELKKQLALLNRRVRYARKKGHNINVEEINRYIARQNEEDVIDFIKSIRREELLAYSYGATEIYDYSKNRNSVDFKVPQPTISPDVYSAITQIEHILLNTPPVVTIQMDVGILGEKDKRIQYDTTEMQDKVFDIFMKQVDYFKSIKSLQTLEDYYEEEAQDRLAEIIQNWTFETYLNESDVLSEFTEMLRLLNIGESLSAEEMEDFSYMYTDLDNIVDYRS